MTDLNYSELRMAILEECLGGRSTAEVSQLIGFSFDKYKRWLDNGKILKWDEFTELCLTLGFNLDEALTLLAFPQDDYNQPKDLFAFLKIRNSFETNQKIADYLNFHVSVIKRYNQGETIPDLETILKMRNYRSNFLAGFLKRLFPLAKNQFLKNLFDNELKGAEFTGHIHAMIQACISLRSYQDKTVKTAQWLSYQLSFDLETIEDSLAAMVSVGTLVQRDDVYTVAENTTNMQNTFLEAIPHYQAMNLRLVERLQVLKSTPQATARPGVMAHRTFAAGEATLKKVNLAILKASSDILKILEDSDEPRTKACCMLLEVFPITK